MYDVQAKKINTLIRCVWLGVVREGGGEGRERGGRQGL